jgi:hypothetical protein
MKIWNILKSKIKMKRKLLVPNNTEQINVVNNFIKNNYKEISKINSSERCKFIQENLQLDSKFSSIPYDCLRKFSKGIVDSYINNNYNTIKVLEYNEQWKYIQEKINDEALFREGDGYSVITERLRKYTKRIIEDFIRNNYEEILQARQEAEDSDKFYGCSDYLCNQFILDSLKLTRESQNLVSSCFKVYQDLQKKRKERSPSQQLWVDKIYQTRGLTEIDVYNKRLYNVNQKEEIRLEFQGSY